MMAIRSGLLYSAAAAAALLHSGSVRAADDGMMMAQCRERAHSEFKIRLPDIDTKYEGQRVDGTHAVNGTAFLKSGTQTFQCSFNRSGDKIVKFVVNKAEKKASDATVSGTEYQATGIIPCRRHMGQPMGQCKFGVSRQDPKSGNGTITIYWPDGGNRVIFYEDNTPMSFDESQADRGAKMTVGLQGDTYDVKIGAQRFEIPSAIMTGG